MLNRSRSFPSHGAITESVTFSPVRAITGDVNQLGRHVRLVQYFTAHVAVLKLFVVVDFLSKESGSAVVARV